MPTEDYLDFAPVEVEVETVRERAKRLAKYAHQLRHEFKRGTDGTGKFYCTSCEIPYTSYNGISPCSKRLEMLLLQMVNHD